MNTIDLTLIKIKDSEMVSKCFLNALPVVITDNNQVNLLCRIISKTSFTKFQLILFLEDTLTNDTTENTTLIKSNLEILKSNQSSNEMYYIDLCYGNTDYPNIIGFCTSDGYFIPFDDYDLFAPLQNKIGDYKDGSCKWNFSGKCEIPYICVRSSNDDNLQLNPQPLQMFINFRTTFDILNKTFQFSKVLTKLDELIPFFESCIGKFFMNVPEPSSCKLCQMSSLVDPIDRILNDLTEATYQCNVFCKPVWGEDNLCNSVWLKEHLDKLDDNPELLWEINSFKNDLQNRIHSEIKLTLPNLSNGMVDHLCTNIMVEIDKD